MKETEAGFSETITWCTEKELYLPFCLGQFFIEKNPLMLPCVTEGCFATRLMMSVCAVVNEVWG